MKTFLKLGICLLITQSAYIYSCEIETNAAQQLEQFFQPIDQAIQDKIFEENKASLSEQAYLGHRYRIAKANLDLIANDNKAFVINPFDDVCLVVKTREIRNFSNGTTQMWVMDKVNPRLDTNVAGMTPEIKEWLNTVKLTVQSSSYYDNSPAPQEVTGVGISRNPFDGVTRLTRSVWGQWEDFNKIFHISPVTDRGEYYLIVQQSSHLREKD